MTCNYPDNCIRGIRKAEFVENGIVTTLAFMPNCSTKDSRADQGYETSINWEDHDQVVNFTLKQPSGIFGALRLPRKSIESINEKPSLSGRCLKYERKIMKGNNHHGNIVFLGCLSPQILRTISGALAVEVMDIILPKE